MTNSADVLRAIQHLTAKLYGEDGFEGDIPAIKKHLGDINGHLENHSRRLVVTEQQIKERTTSRVGKKIITGYSGVAIIIITLLYYLGQSRGWW